MARGWDSDHLLIVSHASFATLEFPAITFGAALTCMGEPRLVCNVVLVCDYVRRCTDVHGFTELDLFTWCQTVPQSWTVVRGLGHAFTGFVSSFGVIRPANNN
jgi:hypothetical protein